MFTKFDTSTILPEQRSDPPKAPKAPKVIAHFDQTLGALGALGGVEGDLGKDIPAKTPSMGDVPQSWIDGQKRLEILFAPAGWPEARWQQMKQDCKPFMASWAAQAHALGWTELDLFGCHPDHPWTRVNCLGLVPLLNGRAVIAVTANSIAIGRDGGARTTFYHSKDETRHRVPVWEVGE